MSDAPHEGLTRVYQDSHSLEKTALGLRELVGAAAGAAIGHSQWQDQQENQRAAKLMNEAFRRELARRNAPIYEGFATGNVGYVRRNEGGYSLPPGMELPSDLSMGTVHLASAIGVDLAQLEKDAGLGSVGSFLGAASKAAPKMMSSFGKGFSQARAGGASLMGSLTKGWGRGMNTGQSTFRGAFRAAETARKAQPGFLSTTMGNMKNKIQDMSFNRAATRNATAQAGDIAERTQATKGRLMAGMTPERQQAMNDMRARRDMNQSFQAGTPKPAAPAPAPDPQTGVMRSPDQIREDRLQRRMNRPAKPFQQNTPKPTQPQQPAPGTPAESPRQATNQAPQGSAPQSANIPTNTAGEPQGTPYRTPPTQTQAPGQLAPPPQPSAQPQNPTPPAPAPQATPTAPQAQTQQAAAQGPSVAPAQQAQQAAPAQQAADAVQPTTPAGTQQGVQAAPEAGASAESPLTQFWNRTGFADGGWKKKLPLLAAAGLTSYGLYRGAKAGFDWLGREGAPEQWGNPSLQPAAGVNEWGVPQR